jgi:hypothetical protein
MYGPAKMTAPPDQSGEGQELRILADPQDHKQTLVDARLMARAVRERWPIDEDKRAAIVNRLCRIVDTEQVASITADGREVNDEDKATRNSIAAARVLVAMIGQNQRDELPHGGPLPPVVNVGVQVNGNPQPGRTLASQIAQRIRAERLSGNPSQ